MDTNLIVLRIAAALYLAATVAALAGVAGRHERSGRLLRWLLGVGLATHVCALGLRAAAVGSIPAASLGESLSILAVLLVGLFLLAHWSKAAILGVIITLIVLVSVKVCPGPGQAKHAAPPLQTRSCSCMRRAWLGLQVAEPLQAVEQRAADLCLAVLQWRSTRAGLAGAATPWPC